MEILGDLQEGEVRVLIRDDQTIDTDDNVTFKEQEYKIRSIDPLPFNEVNVAQALTLSKVQ